MKEYTINFSEYDYEQLIDAFEGIDDEQYPQDALEIYQRILAHLNLDYTNVTVESLGYEDVSTVGWIIHILFRNLLSSIMFSEDELIRRNMSEKISRLNQLLEKSSLNISNLKST